MCGIIGFIGNDALNGILNGLELREYRGDGLGAIERLLGRLEEEWNCWNTEVMTVRDLLSEEPARACRRFTNARDVSKTCGRFLRKPVTIPVASVIQGGRPMAACLIQMRIHIVWEK